MRQTYSRKVLERFMSERELAVIDRRYQESRVTGGAEPYAPSDAHWALYRDWLKDRVTVHEAAAEMTCSDNTVMSRFARMAKLSQT